MITKTTTSLFLILALFVSFPTKIFAQTDLNEISWFFIVVNCLGGLALFLYGMEIMSNSMKKAAGNKMKDTLSQLTKNRFYALFVGTFITAIIQSSSATTAILISLVQAELMRFGQTLGVILGADIGTTITAQLVAFKFSKYVFLIIAIGFFMSIISKKEHIKNIGNAILGFGILFLGMKFMSNAMEPLQSIPSFVNIIQKLSNPFLGILIGASFTAVIQSSSAFMGIIVVMAGNGSISLEVGIPLMFGANIGTCVTAGIACIGTTRDAKRVALAHVLFKIAGVLIFVPFIPQFVDIINYLSDKFNLGTARNIANAHTIFNVGLAFIFIFFTGFFEKMINFLLPDKKEKKILELKIQYLDESQISTPAVALQLARKEISYMTNLLKIMLAQSIVPFIEKGEKKDTIHPELSLIEGIDKREDLIDFLEKEIEEYLNKIGRQNINSEQFDETNGMRTILRKTERIGDIIHRDILRKIKEKQKLNYDFSLEGKKELLEFNVKVCKQLNRLERAFAQTDPAEAKRIINENAEYCVLLTRIEQQHKERVLSKVQESVATHEIHWKLLEAMKRINRHTCEIAEIISSAKW